VAQFQFHKIADNPATLKAAACDLRRETDVSAMRGGDARGCHKC